MRDSGTALNCELREQFENFASASGRDLTTLIDISPRVAQSDDREVLDVWRCENSLNCNKRGQFDNFASASGRNLPNSPLVRSSHSFIQDNRA